MEPLSPLVAIAGGLLIGTAAAIFLLLTGRIAGVSGMTAVATRISSSGTPWSQAAAFVIGLPIGAALIAAFVRTPDVLITASPAVLIIAGLLVGVGTRLGNGCTSGHGVCGMARLSPRSIAATVTFMAAAILTVFVARHVIGG
ncbi:YeeE/YedE family protein [Altererythrobacter sp. SALINAS58]|uniref:YeeE/YedE family protein n=1 Tax=Alteripontixanthobacter muriae TaxID=2705546 RepID=UPI001576F438|nr:YeeE/YedE thiosulfate transporter family protein [Alteripontixanthobacter muriae]NTZ42678.1 YeeE/YedE family protein [Alteripontixanthobacter muriae]